MGRSAGRAALRAAQVNLEATLTAAEQDREMHEEELAGTRAGYEQKLAATRAGYEQNLAATQAEYEQKLAEMQAEYEQKLAEMQAEYERERALFAVCEGDQRDSGRARDSYGTSEFRFALAILMAFDSADAQNFAPANAGVELVRLRDTQ